VESLAPVYKFDVRIKFCGMSIKSVDYNSRRL
jgi:hypothetical protein